MLTDRKLEVKNLTFTNIASKLNLPYPEEVYGIMEEEGLIRPTDLYPKLKWLPTEKGAPYARVVLDGVTVKTQKPYQAVYWGKSVLPLLHNHELRLPVQTETLLKQNTEMMKRITKLESDVEYLLAEAELNIRHRNK